MTWHDTVFAGACAVLCGLLVWVAYQDLDDDQDQDQDLESSGPGISHPAPDAVAAIPPSQPVPVSPSGTRRPAPALAFSQLGAGVGRTHDVGPSVWSPPVAGPAEVQAEVEVVEPEPEIVGDVQAQAYDALTDLGRTHEYDCMAAIFEAESGWNPNGLGDLDRGGSVGLAQRHIPVWGDPRPWTVAEQVVWFTGYADDRYGGWCEARDRWRARSSATVDGRMVGGWW